MNILMLAGQFYPDVAGSAVATQSIATELARLGHEVTVIVDSANEQALIQQGLSFKVEYAAAYKSFMAGSTGFKSATEDIYAIIDRTRFDIIHVFGYLPMLLLSLFKDILSVPVVFTFWSTPYKLERSIGFYDKSTLDMQLSGSIINMKKYDKMVLGSISSYNSAIGQGADPRNTEMIYLGIDLEEFDNFLLKSNEVDFSEYADALHANDRLIMLPGRITRRKGVLEAVEAFATVNRVYSSKLLLVGMAKPYDRQFASVVMQAARELGVAQRIVIPKKVIYRDVMAAFYKRADIVINPSYSEGLGFTAIEALRASRPLVATDVPGLNEILKDGCNGLLVPAQDIKSLAYAITRLIENTGLAQRLSLNGPASVEKFDIRRFVKELLPVYKRLLMEAT